MQTIATTSKVDTTKPLPTCDKCGNPIGKDVMLMGRMYRMPLACLCKIEEQRLEEERFKAMVCRKAAMGDEGSWQLARNPPHLIFRVYHAQPLH